MKFPARLRKPGYRYVAAIALAAALLSSPRWGRRALRDMTFFHVRAVELRGLRYLQPRAVMSQMRVDTTWSVWDDLTPVADRLRRHPQIAQVTVARRLPGRLVVTIRENVPVALVPAGDGLVPYDSAGRALPIDPSQISLDLPIAEQRDTAVLRFLAALRSTQPALYARVSDVRRVSAADMLVRLTPDLVVRAPLGLAPERLADIFPVERDLALRQARVAELDLRYRDQVIARLQ